MRDPLDNTIPFAPQLLDQMDWATLNSLANRFKKEVDDEELLAAAEPLAQLAQLGQLPRGDGVSMQTHRAMKEAGVGPYEQQATPAVKAPDAWGAGSDGKVTQEWKARNAAAQAAERDRLIRLQQERAKKLRQGW